MNCKIALATALAAMAFTSVPVTAQAKDGNAGAAIGLGILGGVLAGAAVASTTPPVYATPPAYHSYPQPGYYYYSTPPASYYSPYSYPGSAAHNYPFYGYR